ncbi:exodeoxyribonuclease VII small subunit [Rhizobium jaguaris]|uniref:exodeoxyribonuclease VII small subunit n=1 Tax=Rhizobium jaguaris TaxID=1312183 RepID=UPI0039BF0D10
MSESAKVDVSGYSFEKAVAELESIVARLERGDVALDESIAIYERGEALKKHCEALLSAAENRIEKIRLGRAGKPQGTEPLDGQ